ncbi:MAG: hypothetical protein RIC16_06260 [Rhodospirillales bacterium]
MAFWQADDDWQYEIFEPSTDPETFGAQADFVALWQSRISDGRLPAWRDYDPIGDFTDWYGWVNVEDVICANPYNARFRLFGSNIARVYDMDLTGTEIRDAPEQFFSDVEFRLSEKLVTERLIARSSGPLRYENRRFYHLSVIEMPLADDGKEVDRVLVHYWVTDEYEES